LSKRKNISFYNNIFVGRDSLLKGEKGIDVFQGNDWWSLTKGGKEMGFEKINGLNLDPDFKNPDHTALTSSAAIESFDHYQIPSNSPLLSAGLNLHESYGIGTGKFDFNGWPAILKGLGACY
jgi:hypothetical protein